MRLKLQIKGALTGRQHGTQKCMFMRILTLWRKEKNITHLILLILWEQLEDIWVKQLNIKESLDLQNITLGLFLGWSVLSVVTDGWKLVENFTRFLKK